MSNISIITPGIPAIADIKIINILKFNRFGANIPIIPNDKIPEPIPKRADFKKLLHLV